MLEKNIEEMARALGIDPKTLPAAAPIFEAKSSVESRNEIQFAEADLTDDEYGLLEPHLPPDPGSEGMLSNRTVLDALIWVHVQGRALTHLPASYGSSEAVRKRAERWAISGIWDQLSDALVDLKLPERRRAELAGLCRTYVRRGERIRHGRQRSR